jgi:hypothetical protein
MQYFRVITALMLLASAGWLSGCGIPLSSSFQNQLPTPAALETAPSGSLPASICLFTEKPALLTDQPLGSHIAWAPDTDTLAYIQPTELSNWFTGQLAITTAPFETDFPLATNAAGDLFWANDASRIAFAALRSEDKVFTVKVIGTDARNLVDLFPAETANTDDFSSRKKITRWLSADALGAYTSCGIDCLQPVTINLLTGTTTSTGDPLRNLKEYWLPPGIDTGDTQVPDETPDRIYAIRPSKDGHYILYQKDPGTNNNLWVYDTLTQLKHALSMQRWRTITETSWSPSGRYLAVLADDRVFIYDFHCTP